MPVSTIDPSWRTAGPLLSTVSSTFMVIACRSFTYVLRTEPPGRDRA
jgi:hypothetical protein